MTRHRRFINSIHLSCKHARYPWHISIASIHKLSYDKQKNVLSLHNDLKHNIKLHKDRKYFTLYEQCASDTDILSLLEQHQDDPFIIDYYIMAFHRLAVLKRFKSAWTLWTELNTSRQHASMMSVQLYTTMMWLSVQHFLSQPDKLRNDKLRQKKTCDKIFSLLSALRHNSSLQLDSSVVCTVISSCTKLHQYGRGEGFWKSLHADNNGDAALQSLQLSIHCYNVMLDLYSKSDQMSEAYELYEQLRVMQHVECNHITFSTLINGCHKHGDIRTAQQIFDDAKKYFAERGQRAPSLEVYCALMNGYASRGDVMQCWQLLVECLQHFETYKSMSEYRPNVMLFSLMLKSLARLHNNEKLRQKTKRARFGHVRKFLEINGNGDGDGSGKGKGEGEGDTQLSVQDCWKMIKYVLLKMKELDIARNIVIYGLLFHLCGDAFGAEHCNFKVAKSFYEQMVEEEHEISSLCMHNFLRVGLCHFEMVEKDESQKQAFVEWLLTEMKKHNVPISSQTRETLKFHKIDIIDHKQYSKLVDEYNQNEN
mmetsp:Transcript_31747/g.51374  ORF Transcript_31747/g.51374 Transcript_31747/m.51374 type:complete len:538 (-) Transcript_31747:34-1647(-)